LNEAEDGIEKRLKVDLIICNVLVFTMGDNFTCIHYIMLINVNKATLYKMHKGSSIVWNG
jgi:hypothetical protein